MDPRAESAIFRAGLLLHYLGLSIKSLGSVNLAWAVICEEGWPWGVAALLLFELFNVLSKIYLIVNLGRLSSARRDDINLCIGSIELTAFNMLAWYTLPSLQLKKNFAMLFYNVMLLSGMTLPPAHVVVGFVLCAPFFW